MKWYASLLKPCPLCGGEAEYVDFPDISVYVKCSKCGTRGAPDDCHQTAVNDWNSLPRMKWVPIDEIPDEWKDGRELLGCGKGWVYVVACWADETEPRWHETSEYRGLEPTHLMEIPKPPEDDK